MTDCHSNQKTKTAGATIIMYSDYLRQRIVFYASRNFKSTTIQRLLKEEGLNASVSGILKFLKKYRKSGTIGRAPGSGRPSKITPEMLAIVDEQMEKDDETTATQLKQLLEQHGFSISISTILRHRSRLGWTFRGSAYCQLIRAPNKIKRLNWSLKYKDDILQENLKDVVWTDECTIQSETHRRFCCRKKGRQAKPKPR